METLHGILEHETPMVYVPTLTQIGLVTLKHHDLPLVMLSSQEIALFPWLLGDNEELYFLL